MFSSKKKNVELNLMFISQANNIGNIEISVLLSRDRYFALRYPRLRNPIVCSGLFLKQTQVYIYIRLMASGIDKIHNCPKCLKEKHFQNFRKYKLEFALGIIQSRRSGCAIVLFLATRYFPCRIR
jgi:hypothetical protein